MKSRAQDTLTPNVSGSGCPFFKHLAGDITSKGSLHPFHQQHKAPLPPQGPPSHLPGWGTLLSKQKGKSRTLPAGAGGTWRVRTPRCGDGGDHLVILSLCFLHSGDPKPDRRPKGPVCDRALHVTHNWKQLNTHHTSHGRQSHTTQRWTVWATVTWPRMHLGNNIETKHCRGTWWKMVF